MKCSYRNCKCDIKNRKSNALYCSVKCKNNEKKYKKRDTLRFNKNKEYVKNILNQFKGGQIEDQTIDLYKLIYSK